MAVVCYTLESDLSTVEQLAQTLDAHQYKPMAEGFDLAEGFVPVIKRENLAPGESEPLFELFDGLLVFALKTSARQFNHDLMSDRLETLCKQYYEKSGNEPDQEWRDAKYEELKKEFRPYSPVSHGVVRGCFDLKNKVLMVFTKSPKQAESVVTYLFRHRKETTDFRMRKLDYDPSAAFLALLHQSATHSSLALAESASFALHKDATVTFNKVSLYGEDVKPFSMRAMALKKASVYMSLENKVAAFNVDKKGVISGLDIEKTFADEWIEMGELEALMAERKKLHFACVVCFRVLFGLQQCCQEITGGQGLQFDTEQDKKAA